MNQSENQQTTLNLLNNTTSNLTAATTTTTTTVSPSNGITIEISAEPQQIITSLRQTMERRIHERAQSWRTNFTNVFQGISPLVRNVQQHANNPFQSWLPQRNTTATNYYDQHQHLSSSSSSSINMMNTQPTVAASPSASASFTTPTTAGDSYVINLDGHGIQASGFAHIQSGARHAESTTAVFDDTRRNVHHQNPFGRGTERNFHLNDSLNNSHRNNGTNSSSNHHHHNGNTSNINNNNSNSGSGNSNNTTDDGPMSEAFQQIPEARAVFVSLLRYTPYISIILAKTCYDHLDGILDFIALFITFSHANWLVRQEVGKQMNRSIMKLLRELLYIVVVISVIGFMLETKNIYISLNFANNFTHPFTLRQLLFSVGVTDLILKLITVCAKILIIITPRRVIEYKLRGQYFLITEACSQLYRGLAPIQPWLVYLLDSYSGSEKLLGVGFSAVYMVAKGSDILQTALFVKRAFITFINEVNFGVKPTKEQLETAGGQCPICHDAYVIPVMLECSHIFCEQCVGTWFDREQTCPLCRAKIVDDPSFRDGSTTHFVQLF